MKYIRYLAIITVALALSFADAAYFSFFEISGITLIISYVVANTLALTGKFTDLAAICYSFVLFFSVFSSLPVWTIFLLFFALPFLFYYLKTNFFPELALAPAFFFFAVSNSLFEVILLAVSGEWNKSGFELVGYFALYNSIAGMVIYSVSKRIQRNFTREEIKI